MNIAGCLGEFFAQQIGSLLPGEHDQCCAQRDDEGEPTSGECFEQIGSKEKAIDHQEERAHHYNLPTVPTPTTPRHDAEQERGDDHVARDRDAVCAT